MRDFIDAAALKDMFLSGAAAIRLQAQAVNELNVFPVPDGDTGTNMSLTITTAGTELSQRTFSTAGEVAATAASALLRGARGNSGVILSLLFRGFSKALKDCETVDGIALATGLQEGVSAAYKAVMKPTEGTILTVSRLAARRALEAAGQNPAVEFVLDEAIRVGYAALANTTEQNPVLKKAGVVDAGAKGYLIILDGMMAALQGRPVTDDAGIPPAAPVSVAPEESSPFSAFETEDITFGYCTEFIVERENDKDPALLRAFLDKLGDSLVVVDDDEIIKVHVHTNEPGTALQEALSYGQLLTVKIENMRRQHTHLLESGPAAAAEPAAGERTIVSPTQKYGFVAVCAGAGLEDVFRNLGVDGLVSGGQTMNPATEDILCQIDRTPAEIVYVLPNNKNIIMAAEQCVPLSEKRVVVLPTATVPEGISAMLAFDPDASEEDNTRAMTDAAGMVRTSSVTYAARDSEFDGIPIREGDYLALSGGKLFSTDTDLTALLDRLARSDACAGASYLSIYYGEDITEEQAAQAVALFEAACPDAEVSLLPGGQPVYYYLISAE